MHIYKQTKSTKLASIATVVIIMALILPIRTAAQDKILYHMDSNTQSIEINPANDAYRGNWYLGFPSLSNWKVSAATSGFKYSDIIREGTGDQKDSLVIDLDTFYDALDSDNYLETNVEGGIINFGFRTNDLFFSLHTSIKSQSRFNFSDKLVLLLKDGNATHLGEEFNIALGLDSKNYLEYALGGGYKINDKVTGGLRLKMLKGAVGVDTDDMSLSVMTTNSADTLQVTASGEILISGPVKVTTDNNGYVTDIEIDDDASYLNGNGGFAIDFGATYQLNSKILLGMSFTDLGSINWNSNLTKLKGEGVYHYTGLDISSSFGNDNNAVDLDEQITEIKDTILSLFKVDEAPESFKTSTNSTVTVSGSYQVNEAFKAGALFSQQLIKDNPETSFTLSGNYNLDDILMVSLGYTAQSHAPANIGFGLTLNGGVLQLTLSSDNIIGMINPAKATYTDVKFGINFVFGQGKYRAKQKYNSVVKQ